MKNSLLVFLIISVIFIIISASFNLFVQNKKPIATINNKTFILDVAKTDEEKTIGLAKYDKLPQNMGMLFPFQVQDYYHFWMKDMKFPIDIIYIKDNKIVDIFTNCPRPLTPDENLKIYTPKTKSNFVLEINANLSKTYNFKIGDTINLNI